MFEVKHGLCYTNEYTIYKDMIRRCYDKNRDDYKDYGGRGIRVCDRWLESVQNFYDDMGPRPSKNHSIHRKDDGDYSPDNCVWATQKEQCREKRNNRLITHNNKTQTLIEWAEEYNIDYFLLRGRLRRGWTMDKALSTPARAIHTVMLSYNGKTQSIIQWAKELNVHYQTLDYRIKQGWTIEQVLSTPIGPRNRILKDNEK